MTPIGWVFMIVSLSFVFGLAAWCYAKVLSLPIEEKKDSGQ